MTVKPNCCSSLGTVASSSQHIETNNHKLSDYHLRSVKSHQFTFPPNTWPGLWLESGVPGENPKTQGGHGYFTMKSSHSSGDLNGKPCCLHQKQMLKTAILHLKSFDVKDAEENFYHFEYSIDIWTVTHRAPIRLLCMLWIYWVSVVNSCSQRECIQIPHTKAWAGIEPRNVS